MSERFYMLRESIMSAACLSQGSILLIHSRISGIVITVLCPENPCLSLIVSVCLEVSCLPPSWAVSASALPASSTLW